MSYARKTTAPTYHRFRRACAAHPADDPDTGRGQGAGVVGVERLRGSCPGCGNEIILSRDTLALIHQHNWHASCDSCGRRLNPSTKPKNYEFRPVSPAPPTTVVVNNPPEPPITLTLDLPTALVIVLSFGALLVAAAIIF